jgi:DNA-binding NarL/FixJ family response regulator
MTVRVVVVDDHRLLREAMCALVDSEPDLSVVGAASAAQEATELVPQADLLLLDVDMPGGGALDLASRLRSEGRVRTLVVSMHESLDYVRSALAAGANGYVFKTSSHRNLIDAIHRVMAGEVYVDPAVASGEIEIPASNAPTLPALSERERAVLLDLARGQTYRDIADRLGIGPRTVETYRRRIAGKLGLRTRADFVRYALELGWMSA